MIEKILHYDIDLRIKYLSNSLSKITHVINGDISKIKKESELQAKINDILSSFKQSPSSSTTLKKSELLLL